MLVELQFGSMGGRHEDDAPSVHALAVQNAREDGRRTLPFALAYANLHRVGGVVLLCLVEDVDVDEQIAGHVRVQMPAIQYH